MPLTESWTVALSATRSELADAQDNMVLRRTLYGTVRVEDFTREQAKDMIDAAHRIVDRRAERYEIGPRGRTGQHGSASYALWHRPCRGFHPRAGKRHDRCRSATRGPSG